MNMNNTNSSAFSMNSGGAQEPKREAFCLQWEAEMKLLNNRFFLSDTVKWIAWTLLFCAIIFVPLFGIPGGWEGLQAAFVILSIGLGLLLVSILIFVLVMGNRVPMAFKIDADGVNMESVSRRMKGINNAAMILGILARKPGAVGAGATGRSQENTTILWNELKRVGFYPSDRVIFLKGGIFSRIRLYCTAENYPTIGKAVRERMPSGVKVY